MNEKAPWGHAANVQDDPVLAKMLASYKVLLSLEVTDPERWREVHRRRPAAARQIFLLACLLLDPLVTARVLFDMTQSPAMLFTELGDGIAFDERTQTAAFASQASADVFLGYFPEWSVTLTARPTIEDCKQKVLHELSAAYGR